MAILFTKPTKAAKRLKLMLYGVAGVGKTTAAIQFPNPAIIDTERGAENDTYVDLINAKGGAILSTSSFDTIMEQVKALATTEHPYRTLVIDPITVVYDAMATAWEKRVGDEWSRHRAKAVTDWKRLTNLLAALDMNVVFTSHAKSEWVNGESTGRFTFDGPKGADYWMDLVIEVQRSGEERFGIIRKSRIKTLPVDETFPFSYDELADRYGRDVLERDSKPVASQYLELMDLIESREDGEDIASRILKKKGVATLSELSLDDIQKAIEWLING